MLSTPFNFYNLVILSHYVVTRSDAGWLIGTARRICGAEGIRSIHEGHDFLWLRVL